MRQAATLLLLGALGLGSTSCAVMLFDQGGHVRGSGTLSQAAAQAVADSAHRYEVDRPDVGYATPPTVVTELVVYHDDLPPMGEELGRAARAAGALPVFVGIVAGRGSMGGGRDDGYHTVGLSVSGYPLSRLRVDGVVSYEDVRFADRDHLEQAFRKPLELNLDVTGRWYLTPGRAFTGIYPLAGVGTGTLFWDYARPVTVIENGSPTTLDTDQLNYFTVFGGAGMSLVQTPYVHVGANVTTGLRYYGWHTASGLRNDLLKPTGYMKVLVELSFFAKNL